MRTDRVLLGATWLLLCAEPETALPQVVSWEGTSFPEADGWNRTAFCTPERSFQDGWLCQVFQIGECGPPPGGERDTYRRPIGAFEGAADFFLDFRVLTTGERSEIPGGAPVAVAAGSSGAVSYNLFIARDQIKFVRDVWLPILFIDVEPEIPHTIRLEFNNHNPPTFRWYLDGQNLEEGLAEGPYPSFEPRIVWQGSSWFLPNETCWDYIRYGVIPLDGSGDYDSDGAVTQDDFYFFHDCLTKDGPVILGGPDNDAGPGCRFSDFDSDGGVDLLDFAAFQNAFRGVP